MLQRVAVSCRAVQCGAASCSVLHTVCYCELQRVIVWYSVLQCVAVCCSTMLRGL